MQNKLTTQQLEDAIWDYIMEHSDVTPNGTIFVKFHVTKKSKFIGHIISRAHGYHRGNPDTKYIKALIKQKEHKDRCQEGVKKSKEKKDEYVINPKAIKLNSVYNNSPKIIKPIINFYGKNILKVF